MPILFKTGDIIKERDELFYVYLRSSEIRYFDFTDECYFVYYLECDCKNLYEFEASHNHIGVCFATGYDKSLLTDKQKKHVEDIEEWIRLTEEYEKKESLGEDAKVDMKSVTKTFLKEAKGRSKFI